MGFAISPDEQEITHCAPNEGGGHVGGPCGIVWNKRKVPKSKQKLDDHRVDSGDPDRLLIGQGESLRMVIPPNAHRSR